MHLKDADGMANSLDHDQTAPGTAISPRGAVWSGSTLFAIPEQSDQDLRLFARKLRIITVTIMLT